MDTRIEQTLDPGLLKAITEASVWVNWQHGGEWSQERALGLESWLAESEVHRVAYREVEGTRNAVRAAVRHVGELDVVVPERAIPVGHRRNVSRVWAVAAALVLAIAGALFYLKDPGLETEVGERRTAVLDDGTQVLLNTSTRIVVDYNKQQRHVRLISGEAYFAVAKRPDWPFVVTAANHEVVAVGTAFVVRQDEQRFAVTMVEGKVAVTEVAQSMNEKTAPSTRPVMLTGGDRLTYVGRSVRPELDRPVVDKVTSWREGVLYIENMTLAEAASEINRYNKVKLVVEGPATQIRTGGILRSMDARTFANALALTHGLSLHEEGARIVVSGVPRPAIDREFDRDNRSPVERP